MPRILVTGATGTVGRAVVAALRAEGAEVRALTRSPETAALPNDVEVVRGDLADPASLGAALDGVDAVFLMILFPAAAEVVSTLAAAPGRPRVVLLSSPHQTPHPFFQQPNASATLHAEVERLLAASGLATTVLRPTMFAANALHWWAPAIRAGSPVRWPYVDVDTAPIDERDIAAVAARALLDAGHAGADYLLTGPARLTQAEQLRTIGEVSGRPVRVEALTPDEARQAFAAWPPAAVSMLLAAWGAAVGHPAIVTTTVGDVTGTPARPFARWVADHADAFR